MWYAVESLSYAPWYEKTHARWLCTNLQHLLVWTRFPEYGERSYLGVPRPMDAIDVDPAWLTVYSVVHFCKSITFHNSDRVIDSSRAHCTSWHSHISEYLIWLIGQHFPYSTTGNTFLSWQIKQGSYGWMHWMSGSHQWLFTLLSLMKLVWQGCPHRTRLSAHTQAKPVQNCPVPWRNPQNHMGLADDACVKSQKHRHVDNSEIWHSIQAPISGRMPLRRATCVLAT